LPLGRNPCFYGKPSATNLDIGEESYHTRIMVYDVDEEWVVADYTLSATSEEEVEDYLQDLLKNHFPGEETWEI